MTLARKTIVLFLSFIFALTAIFLVISNTVWHKGYLELERREVMNEVKRAHLAMNNEFNRLHTLVQDWGPWDDTYQFAQDLDEIYVQKNLSESAMSNFKMSYFLIVSPEGRPLYERAFDLSANKVVPPPPGQAAEIARLASDAIGTETGLTGIIRLADGTPLIVTAHPILTSERRGPAMGTLWFARRADNGYIEELSNLVQSEIFWSGAAEPVWEETDDTVKARWSVPVLNGQPLVLGVTVPRAIVHFGLAQRNEFLLIILAASFVFLALSLAAIDRLLLRRLRKVSAFFKELAERPRLSRRLALEDQQDELNQVASSVNRLLSRLEHAQVRIRALFQTARKELASRKQAEKRLQHLSHHDALTGLFNRLHFETETARLIKLRRDLGVVVCDVDGLKLVNDSFGHAAGDLLLRRAADLLRRLFGQYGIICRIGGDEFAILWPGAAASQLETVTQQMHLLLAQQEADAQEPLRLDISVGYCFIAGEELTTESFYHVFTKADDAMYRQKLSHDSSNRSALVQSMMSLLEARDYITEGHSQRLQDMCHQLGQAAGLSSVRLDDLKLLAQFHDIGKISIPDHILFKPGPLSPEEWQQMHRHPEIGHRIARHIPNLSAIAPLILHHHERWDGQGYPLGLSGESIPLESRVLALVDSYDAMTNDRPYRKALTHHEALTEIKKNHGRMFDPHLTDLFLAMYQNMPAVPKQLSPDEGMYRLKLQEA